MNMDKTEMIINGYHFLNSLGLGDAFLPSVDDILDADQDDEYRWYKKTIRSADIVGEDIEGDEDIYGPCDVNFEETLPPLGRFASLFAATLNRSTSINTQKKKKIKKSVVAPVRMFATTCANLTSAPATMGAIHPATKTLMLVPVKANSTSGSQRGLSRSPAQIQVVTEQGLKLIPGNTSSSRRLRQGSPLATATFKALRVEEAASAFTTPFAGASSRLRDWRPVTPEDLDDMICYPLTEVTGRRLTTAQDASTSTHSPTVTVSKNVCSRCNTVVVSSPYVLNFSDHTYERNKYPSSGCGCSCLETPCASPDSAQNATKSDSDSTPEVDEELLELYSGFVNAKSNTKRSRNAASMTCAKSPRAQKPTSKRRITEAADVDAPESKVSRAMTPEERREHNEKEKARRANMRKLFNVLSKQIPIPTRDPSKPTPRQEVLQKAKETIEYLEKQQTQLLMQQEKELKRHERLKKELLDKQTYYKKLTHSH